MLQHSGLILTLLIMLLISEGLPFNLDDPLGSAAKVNNPLAEALRNKANIKDMDMAMLGSELNARE